MSRRHILTTALLVAGTLLATGAAIAAPPTAFDGAQAAVQGVVSSSFGRWLGVGALVIGGLIAALGERRIGMLGMITGFGLLVMQWFITVLLEDGANPTSAAASPVDASGFPFGVIALVGGITVVCCMAVFLNSEGGGDRETESLPPTNVPPLESLSPRDDASGAAAEVPQTATDNEDSVQRGHRKIAL